MIRIDWQEAFSSSFASFFPRKTGLSRKVWFASKSCADEDPFMTVGFEEAKGYHESIPVQIYPEILIIPGYGTLPQEIFKQVQGFIELNLGPILDYWFEAIDAGELSEELKDVDGRCISERD